MSDNTDSIAATLPKGKLRSVADRVVRQLELAGDKVAAHQGDAAKYPLPADKSALELLLLARFKALPENVRKEAAERVLKDIRAASVRAKRYGDLAKVDLRSPASVDAQIRTLPFPDKLKMTEDELRGSLPMPHAVADASATGTQPLGKLELRLHRVKCVDDTSEIGQDEFYLGGTEVDESGDTRKVPQFKVMSCKTGDVKTYDPPRRFTWFSTTESQVAFPKGYFVTLAAAEVDDGGFADFLDELLDAVKTQVVAALAAAVGGAIGAAGGPVTIIIGAAVGYVVGAFFQYLKTWWGDEIFTPVTVSTIIASTTSRWNGQTATPRHTLVYAGYGGRYEVDYDWHMFA